MLIDTPSARAEDLVEAFNTLGRSVDGIVVLRLETPSPAETGSPTACRSSTKSTRWPSRVA